MPTVADLGRKVKQKYPEYADMDDAELGRRVKAKYPEYGDFTDEPETEDAAYLRRRGGTQPFGGAPVHKPKPAPSQSELETARRIEENPVGPEAIERLKKSLPPEQQKRFGKQGSAGYGYGLGPIVEGAHQSLTGASQLPSRPWKGGTNIVQGAFHAASVAAPSLAKAAPKALAAAIPESMAAHWATDAALERLGVPEEPREFAAEVAAGIPWVAAGRKVLSPKPPKPPPPPPPSEDIPHWRDVYGPLGPPNIPAESSSIGPLGHPGPPPRKPQPDKPPGRRWQDIYGPLGPPNIAGPLTPPPAPSAAATAATSTGRKRLPKPKIAGDQAPQAATPPDTVAAPPEGAVPPPARPRKAKRPLTPEDAIAAPVAPEGAVPLGAPMPEPAAASRRKWPTKVQLEEMGIPQGEVPRAPKKRIAKAPAAAAEPVIAAEPPPSAPAVEPVSAVLESGGAPQKTRKSRKVKDQAAPEAIGNTTDANAPGGGAPFDVDRIARVAESLRKQHKAITIANIEARIPDMPKSQLSEMVQAGIEQGKWHITQDGKSLRMGKASERGAIVFGNPPPQTPGELAAQANLEAREAARTAGAKPLRERFQEWYTRFKSGWSDSAAGFLDPLRRAERAAGYVDAKTPEGRKPDPLHGGSKVLPTERLNVLVDRSLRSDNLARQFVADHGFDRVYRSLDNPDYFGEYLIARHAQHLRHLGIKVGRDAARDATIIKEFSNRRIKTGETYQQLADGWVRDFTNKQLQYAVDKGLISSNLANHLRRLYPDYIPFNRVFSEDWSSGPGTERGVAHLPWQTVVRKLHGSDRPVEDPFLSLAQKTVDMFAQGTRNEAARTLAKYGLELGLPMKQAKQEVVGGKTIWKYNVQGKWVHGPKPRRDATFSFLENGERQILVTDPILARAARSLDVRDVDLLTKISGAFVRALKVGTTGPAAPGFLIQNIAADVASTLTTARSALPRRFLSSFWHVLRNSAENKEMVRGGGGFNSFDPFRRSELAIDLERIRAQGSAKAQLGYVVNHPIRAAGEAWRAIEDLASVSETAGRLRLYRNRKAQALEHGFSPEDAELLAVYEANNAAPNYLRQGNYARVLNNISAYFTAGVAGVRAHLQAAARDPGRVAIATTALMLPQALATLWNMGIITSGNPEADERRAKAYQDIKKYEKEGHLLLLDPDPLTEEPHKYSGIKIRLQTGWVRSFLNMTRIPLEAAVQKSPMEWKAMLDAAFGVVSPIEPNINSLLSVGFPQTVKPAAQAIANYDFFREQPKIPRHLQDQPKQQQAMPYTSGTARKTGKALDVPPILVDEFITDTFGAGGRLALGAIDRVLAATGQIPPEQVKGQTPAEQLEQRVTVLRGGRIQEDQFATLENIKRSVEGQRATIEEIMKQLYVDTLKLPADQRAEAWDQGVAATAMKLNVEEDYVSEIAERSLTREEIKKTSLPIDRAVLNAGGRAAAEYILKDIMSLPQDQRAARFEEWSNKTVGGRAIMNDSVYEQIMKMIGSEPAHNDITTQ